MSGYRTLTMPSDTALQLSDHDWPLDSAPHVDESRIAEDIALALIEVEALDRILEETEEKGRAA